MCLNSKIEESILETPGWKGSTSPLGYDTLCIHVTLLANKMIFHHMKMKNDCTCKLQHRKVLLYRKSLMKSNDELVTATVFYFATCRRFATTRAMVSDSSCDISLILLTFTWLLILYPPAPSEKRWKLPCTIRDVTWEYLVIILGYHFPISQ